jgi:hypothetical protein
MTDLEICKRIAEIEGFLIDPDDKYPRYLRFKSGEHVGYKAYNPLTDDALCFKLMVKYDCDLVSPYRPNNNTHWECQIFTGNRTDAVSIYNESPNKAICLAIIEAHK